MALFHTTVVDNQIKALDTIGSVSGAIATFDTDRAENLVKCVCEVASGSSEINIVACGKNLIDQNGFVQGGLSGTGAETMTNYDYRVRTGFIPFPNGTYRLTTGTTSIRIDTINFYSGTTFISRVIPNASDYTLIKSVGNNIRIVLKKYPESNTIIPSDVTTFQCELGEIATSYTPYTGYIYNIVLGETLSGDGTFDVLSGILTRSDDTTKHVDGNAIAAQVGTNNIYADTGDIIDLKFVLTVGKAIS